MGRGAPIKGSKLDTESALSYLVFINSFTGGVFTYEARRNGNGSEPTYGKGISLITSHSGRGSEKTGHG
jgi:hypothetical protein